MIIRRETETDLDGIYDLIKVAFQTAQVSDGSEQDFAVRLRGSENYIPELALVAETKGRLVGHIMLTRIYVEQEKERFESLILAPLSVLAEYRNQGVGSMLIRESLVLAKKMGYKAVFLVGNPDYYQRFGFKKSADYGIRYAGDIPEQYVMALELVSDALKGIHGVFKC